MICSTRWKKGYLSKESYKSRVMVMVNGSPEVPQIIQLSSEEVFRDLSEIVASNFPVSGSTRRLAVSFTAFLRTAQASAPHVASLAVFNRSEVYLSPIMDIHAVWVPPLLAKEQAPEIRKLDESWAGLCIGFEDDFTALLHIWYPQKYPSLENLISRVAAEECPHATSLRLVACAQFQR